MNPFRPPDRDRPGPLARFLAFALSVVFVFFLVGFGLTVITVYEALRGDSGARFAGVMIEVAL